MKFDWLLITKNCKVSGNVFEIYLYAVGSGCEACNEWYHGDCINVTADESQYIKHWYCHICRGELLIYM